ncbi:MAG: SOS response-associated peptidase [Gemmataceae bacterium]
MCGRFSLGVSTDQLKGFFPLFDLPASLRRYNIAPTQDVLAVRVEKGKEKPQGGLMRWGLVPYWAEDLSIGNKQINARAETLATKPAFRSAFQKRRCLILADGFYEWKKLGKEKQPFHIHNKDGSPFAFAGLWEYWKKKEGADAKAPASVESCAIITTDANELVASLHDRMPAILDPGDYLRWLDPAPVDPAVLQEMLRPYPAAKMEAVAVSKRVNNVANEGAECVAPEAGAKSPQWRETTLF